MILTELISTTPVAVSVSGLNGQPMIVVAFDGKGECWRGAQEHSYEKGDVLLFDAGDAIGLRCAKPGEGLCGLISARQSVMDDVWQAACKACGTDSKQLPFGGKTSCTATGFDTVRQCFALLFGHSTNTGSAGHEISRLALQALLTFVANEYAAIMPQPGETVNARGLVERVCQNVYRRFAEPISLELFARENGVSAPHLSSLFHRQTGVLFSEFLSAVRLERAMVLLAATDDLVIDISVDTGFSSASYFNFVFLRHTGMRPLQYRKKFRSSSGYR